jgi:hypothetical protein
MTQQLGISPKLYPCLLGIGLGAVVIALGQKEAGVGILVTGAGALIAGYHLPVGELNVEVPQEGSDGLLDPDVLSQIVSTAPGEALATVTQIEDTAEAAATALPPLVPTVAGVLDVVRSLIPRR